MFREKLERRCFYSRRARNASIQTNTKRGIFGVKCRLHLWAISDQSCGALTEEYSPCQSLGPGCVRRRINPTQAHETNPFCEASISATWPMCMAAYRFGPAYQRISHALTSSDSNRCRLRSAFLNRGSNGWQCRFEAATSCLNVYERASLLSNSACFQTGTPCLA